jgi:hypothetical protein
MVAEAPYRLPAHIDFARIELVLKGKAAAARDRLWAMREDPAYLVDCINDPHEHRVEVLRDMKNGLHPYRGEEGRRESHRPPAIRISATPIFWKKGTCKGRSI